MPELFTGKARASCAVCLMVGSSLFSINLKIKNDENRSKRFNE